MNITVLDSATLDDLNWTALHQLGQCQTYFHTPLEQVVARARDAEIILTNKTMLQAEQLAQLPKLRYIGVLATGYNNVDTLAAQHRHIPVCNVPAYGAPSVAQHVFALLFALTRQVEAHSQTVHAGQWSQQSQFCYWNTPQVALDGLTLGIVGLGDIGQEVAKLGLAFGMQVQATTRTPKQLKGVKLVDIETLFASSDVISLNCSLTSETEKLVNATRLATMRPAAYLINAGRGSLVDEVALAEALQTGQIAGAGLDTLSQEPPPITHPLFNIPNCIITPHLAWTTLRARQNLLNIAISNVTAFLAGESQNQVN